MSIIDVTAVTIDNYHVYVARTDGFQGSKTEKLSTKDIKLWMILTAGALLGEAVELETEISSNNVDRYSNIYKEIGDNTWYMASHCASQGKTFDYMTRLAVTNSVSFCNINELVTLYLRACGRVEELVKKQVGHGHQDITPEIVVESIALAFHYLQAIAAMVGTTITHCLKLNVNKLATRYPKGFNTQDSINRFDLTGTTPSTYLP